MRRGWAEERERDQGIHFGNPLLDIRIVSFLPNSITRTNGPRPIPAQRERERVSECERERERERERETKCPHQ
jgi:hypothetical protein